MDQSKLGEIERLRQLREKLAGEKEIPTAWAGEFAFLLELIAAKDARIAQLEKKTGVLSTQITELTQEMENVKMDFGGQR